MDERDSVENVGAQTLGGGAVGLHELLGVEGLCAELGEFAVGLLHLLADEVGEFGSQHVATAQARAGDLGGVCRANPAPRGADLLARGASGFVRLVQGAVVEHDHVGARGDEETPAALNARLPEHLDLLYEVEGIHHHAITDHARLARVQDSRGDQAQNALLALGDDGVPGVRATLVADNHVRLSGEHVNNLSLTLVAPLRSN